MTSKDVREQETAEPAEPAQEIRDLDVEDDREADEVKGGWPPGQGPGGISLNHSERSLP